MSSQIPIIGCTACLLYTSGPENKDGHDKHHKKVAEEDLGEFVDELAAAQELLWANGTYSLLIVLQAMDAAGKDGTIKHVMSGVNPQGCRVEAFKQPSAEELGHDFLWRCSKALPELGAISIFNRSYYEDVLVTRVHPDLLDKSHDMPSGGPNEKFWNCLLYTSNSTARTRSKRRRSTSS